MSYKEKRVVEPTSSQFEKLEMDILRFAIWEKGIAETCYSILQDASQSPQDVSVTIEKGSDGLWYVYLFERGSAHFVSAHSNFVSAARDFWSRLPDQGEPFKTFSKKFRDARMIQ